MVSFFARILITVLFVAQRVFASCPLDKKIPLKVKIGGIFPLLKHDGTAAVDEGGIQYLAAFKMAIDDLNNKTDGVYDFVLPCTTIDFAIQESPGPFIDDVYAAIKLSADVFNSTGVNGVVGAHTNAVSNAIAQIFNGINTRNLHIFIRNDHQLIFSTSQFFYLARF